MTKELIEVHWTCGSLDEARRLSRHLIQERVVASAQIIPWMESIYLLDNQLDTLQESKVILKTHYGNYPKIKEFIEKNSKYEIPEIVFFKIEGGNQSYLDWLQSQK